ncbi:MAG: hypothetical protein ACRD16_01185 [Thermoanaerobaculia bacterium]
MDSKDVAEIKRHIGVVMEDVQSKMKLIAEGVSGIDVRMERVEGSQNRVESRLDRVEARLDRVDSQLGKIDNRLSAVEDRLDRSLLEHKS